MLKVAQRSRVISLILLVGLFLTTAACGGSKSGSPAPETPDSGGQGPIAVASLAEALELIAAEERSHQAKALPASVQADEAWLAGPSGSFTADSGAHTMELTSSGPSPDSPTYISFAIYRLTGHGADSVDKLNFSATVLGQEYRVYAVEYSGTAVWNDFGVQAGGAQEIDLSTIDAVSGSGNVYVAFATYGDTTLTINGQLTIDSDTPPPPTYYETENNEIGDPEDNDRSMANPLPAFPFDGDDVTGSLGGEDTGDYTGYDEDGIDWYSFNVVEPGTVSISMIFENNGGYLIGDLELELWDEAGTAALDSSVGIERAERIDHAITAPGTYYIKCRNRDINPDSYGDYTLWGRFYPDSGGNSRYYETESNDTFGTADSLPALAFGEGIVLGSIGAEGIYDGGQEDWYSFTMSSQKIVTFNIYTDSDETSPELAIFGSDGTTLLVEDTGSGVWTAVSALVNSGTSYVRVRETSATAGGDYELTAEQRDYTPGSYFEVESNNDSVTANALPAFPFTAATVGGSVGAGGGFYDGSNDDWFSFTISGADKIVTVTMTRQGALGSGKIELVDSDGTTVIDSASSAPYEVAGLFSPGTYYVHVSASSAGFDYTLDGVADDFSGDTYYEDEDNDDFGSANALPAFDFDATAVNGSLGDGGFYDGDAEDWFKFDIMQSGTLRLFLAEDNDAADLSLYLYDTDGTTELADSNTASDPEGVHYHFTSTGTYFIKCTSGSVGSTYTLAATFNTGTPAYSESENNDSTAEADNWPSFPFSGNQVFGNVGLDGANDGDEDDWFTFNLSNPAVVHLLMHIETPGGDIDIKVFEADGTTEVGTSTGTSDTEEITTEELPAGTYYVRVYAYTGDANTSDYRIDGDLQ